MTEFGDAEFWRRFDQHMTASAELGARFEEVGRRKRMLIAQLEQELGEREAAHRAGITWHSVRFGLDTSTSGTGAGLALVAGAWRGGAAPRRRRWLWR